VSSSTSNPLDLLPHRFPFRFLTRIDVLERGVHATGVWKVSGSEDFLAGHFPGEPLVPGVLIGEALAQLSGLVGVTPGAPGRLAQIDIRFRLAVSPPAEVALSSRLRRSLGHVSMYDVVASVGGQAVADGTIVLGVSVQA
jgi:3-hydroxyacyl-[acyl-carrier-protein] dehydratase